MLNPNGLLYMGIFRGFDREGVLDGDNQIPKRFFNAYTDKNIKKAVSQHFKIIKYENIISKEKVCVACAMDRSGNIIMDLICLGRMTHTELSKFYDGHVEENSIFCTDSHKSYIKFAQDLGLDHKRIKTGHHKE